MLFLNRMQIPLWPELFEFFLITLKDESRKDDWIKQSILQAENVKLSANIYIYNVVIEEATNTAAILL